jgi:DNA-binding transcriptional LysR family regulator
MSLLRERTGHNRRMGREYGNDTVAQKLPRLVQRSLLRVQQLNMVLRLVETGSVSAAAHDLGLSQSAVTKSLKELETLFGVPLFDRESRGLRPTIYCDPLERFARDVVLGLDETGETIRALLHGEVGAVSIGTNPGKAQNLLAAGLRRVRADRPRLSIRLHTDSSLALLGQVESGNVDFALLSPPAYLDRQVFAYVPVGEEGLVALVRPQHPLSQQPGISTDALMDSAWALPTRREPLREVIAFALMATGTDQPPDLIEVNSNQAALELAVTMDLIVVVPESMAEPFVRQRLLRVIPLPYTLPVLPFGLVRFRHRQLRPGAHAVLQMLTRLARAVRRGTAETPLE